METKGYLQVVADNGKIVFVLPDYDQAVNYMAMTPEEAEEMAKSLVKLVAIIRKDAKGLN